MNYRTTPDWEKEVRAVTGGRGADLVIDVAGQETLGRSVRAVRMGGTVTVTGVLSGVGAARCPSPGDDPQHPPRRRDHR